MLYSLGDLTLAADAAGTRSQSVTNLSGDIEAGGNLIVNAQQITNERRVLETETYTLSPAEQQANRTTRTTLFDWTTDPEATTFCNAYAQTIGMNGHAVRCGPLGYYGDAAYDTLTQTILSITRLTAASAESRLLAGGNIRLNGSVLNSNATIAAGNHLIINGQDGNNGGGNVGSDTVQNLAFVPTVLLQNDLVRSVDGDYRGKRWYSNRESNQPPMVFAEHVTSATLAAGSVPFLTLDAGPSLRATMSAGNAVDIRAQDVSNTPVGADGKPVSGVGLGQNSSGPYLSGQGGGGAGNVVGNTHPGNLGNLGPAPGAPFVGTPQQPYPVQLPRNGLYTLHPGNGSPYLVETDPRFATMSGFLGSDYLLNQLGLQGDLTLKRLGDAFYETQLVMDQLTSLTGRRFLDGNGDALEQYKALMDAGTQEAQSFNLSVGVALTPAQIASLTQDMVWLVNQTVNGEQVLVPVVYLSQNTASHVASGAVMQGSTVSINASNQLTNTGTLQASNDARLKAGNLLNAGTVAAGGNLSVQAAQDLLNAGALQGGNVALVAGNNLTSRADSSTVSLGTVNLSGLSLSDAQRAGIATGGQLSATGILTAQAGNNLNLDHANVNAGQNLGLAAGNDLTATASTLNAGNDAQLIAGHNFTLNAAAGQGSSQQSAHAASASTHTDVTTLHAGGSAVLAAGNDLTSQGAQLQAGDQLALSAGHDLTLNAVTDTQSQGNSWQSGHTQYNQITQDQSLRGTTLDAAHGIALSAGHDLTTVAANVTSSNGAIALAAGNDVNLHAAQENHSWQQDSTTKKSGLLSSSTTTTHDASQDSLAVGTLLSGNTVTVAAGHDVNTQAAQIVATDDIVMAAGNNLNIGVATDTHSEQHERTTKTSGVFTSGLNLMIGSSKESNTYTETDTTPQGSLIGSLNGGVTLTAGNLVHITGSEVLSDTGTAIVGNDVTLDAAVGTQDITQTYKQQQAGITLGLGGGLASVAQSVYGRSQAANHAEDDRLKALYASQSAYTAYEAYNAYQDAASAAASAGTNVGQGISLRIGLGASSASSSTTTHDETAYGSRIQSNGDVVIAATGGDLTIIGSQVNGQNVALAAANHLNLLSQAENHSLESTNKNASGGIGLQIGSNGFGVYAEGSVGQGSAHGNGTSHAISSINANDTLTLISGNDTTIKGAQLTGNTVLANVGNHLLIQSEQDTDDFASKQQQIGGAMVIGAGGGGSFSYSQNKSSSHYAGVTDVSGIGAGSGGFDITVGGNTHLVGGVIASRADPSKNSLTTGTLLYEDIQNQSSGKVSSSSLGSDNSVLSGSKYAIGKTVVGNLMGGGSDDEAHSSTTHSAIANGTIAIADGQAQQALTGKSAEQAMAGLSRDASLDNQALARPDLGKLQANAELEQVANSLGYQMGTHFTDEAYRTMFVKSADVYEVAYDENGKAIPGRKLTDEQKMQLQPGKDGAVYIADNGIFNGNEAAAKYADQHSSAGDGPQYYIAFPEAGNALSELLVAGYQKNLENDFWGLTHATQETKWMMLYYGQDALHFDGHSRGAMTIGNALESIAKTPGAEGVLSGMTVSLFGPAYNAAKADQILGFLQDRDAIADPAQRQGMVLTLQNHIADPVGRFIGGNPATGGTIPDGSSSLWEMIRAGTGQKDTSHNCYGASKDAACGNFWQDFPTLMPMSMPASGRKE
ncbi:hemagglutinin repeat-containing protein [Dyella sp. M7H15-1]|uniref:hemagglutinin repeat-containing protein n=2 Tax=Gammaproteobacteria TaxID=1236 RepID=UPI0031B71536